MDRASGQDLAIERAKMHLSLHSGAQSPRTDPSTTVHLLVMQPRRFMR